jgi:hypothetical protein
VNLTEKSAANRRKVSNLHLPCFLPEDSKVEEMSLLEMLVKLFIKHESMARTIDEELDNELMEEIPEDEPAAGSDDEESASGQLNRANDMNEDEIISALNSAMKKATSHMHDSMTASYIGLLIGCLVQTDEVRDTLLRNTYNFYRPWLKSYALCCLMEMPRVFWNSWNALESLPS